MPTRIGGTSPEVALVGCGRWGKNVLRDLLSLGCRVPVVARSAESVARARAAGATDIRATVEALPPIAGAVICTPTSTHDSVIREVAAAHDCPIFVEKPMTVDPADADQLARELGDRLFVMDKWRYHPAIEELARMARSAELGPVSSLHLRRVTLGHRYSDVDTVHIHAPHDLAIALEILGAVPPVVAAAEERLRGERVGLTATLGGPPWVSLEVSCTAPRHHRELRMVCEGGVAILDGGWSEELLIVRDVAGDPKPEPRPVPGELPLLAELRAFVEHIRGGPGPRTSAADGAAIVRRLDEMGRVARAMPEAACT